MRTFISYCHADKELFNRLKVHLKSLEREELIEPWSDYGILPGENIDDEIKVKMEESELFLLLVSPDFIASDYCYGKELQHAIDRHNSGTAKVIPIILEPCNLESISELLELKALPEDAKPISTFENLNTAFSQVIKGIKKVIYNYNKQSHPEQFGSNPNNLKKTDTKKNTMQNQSPTNDEDTIIDREELSNRLIRYLGDYVYENGHILKRFAYDFVQKFGMIGDKLRYSLLIELRDTGKIEYTEIRALGKTSTVRNISLTSKGWEIYKQLSKST